MDDESNTENIKPSEIKRHSSRFQNFRRILSSLFMTVLRYPHRETFSNAGGNLTINQGTKSKATISVPNIGDNTSSRRVCVRVRPNSENLSLRGSGEEILFSQVYEFKTEKFSERGGFEFEFTISRKVRKPFKFKVMCEDYDTGDVRELSSQYRDTTSTIKVNIEKPTSKMTVYALLYSSDGDVMDCIDEDIEFDVSISGPPLIKRCMCFTVLIKHRNDKDSPRKNSSCMFRSNDTNHCHLKGRFVIDKYQDIKMTFRIQGTASSDWDIEGDSYIKRKELKSHLVRRTFSISYEIQQREPTQSVNCILEIHPTEEEAPVRMPFTLDEAVIKKSMSRPVKRSMSAIMSTRRSKENLFQCMLPTITRHNSMDDMSHCTDNRGDDAIERSVIKSSKYNVKQHVKRLCEGFSYDRNDILNRLADHRGVTTKWKNFARTLGVGDSDIYALEKDEPHSLRERITQMLLKAEEMYPFQEYLIAVTNALVTEDICDVIPIIVGEALLYTIATKSADADINFKNVFEREPMEDCPEKLSGEMQEIKVSDMKTDAYEFLKDKYLQHKYDILFIQELREILRDEACVESLSGTAELVKKAEDLEKLSRMLSSLRKNSLK